MKRLHKLLRVVFLNRTQLNPPLLMLNSKLKSKTEVEILKWSDQLALSLFRFPIDVALRDIHTNSSALQRFWAKFTTKFAMILKQNFFKISLATWIWRWRKSRTWLDFFFNLTWIKFPSDTLNGYKIGIARSEVMNIRRVTWNPIWRTGGDWNNWKG